MLSSRSVKTGVITCVVTLAFLFQLSMAEARGERHRPPIRYPKQGTYVRHLPRGHFNISVGDFSLCYWEGIYYRPIEKRYVVVPAPIGAVVTAIPRGYAPVVINGAEYYEVNDATYINTPEGYQVVPEPKVIIIKDSELKASAKAELEAEKELSALSSANAALSAGYTSQPVVEVSFTVNIPRSDGKYTAVTLKRSGEGFIGPQGEYYEKFPTVEQMRVMYAE